MQSIQKIGIWSFCKFNMIVGAIFGLLIGIFFSISSFILGSFASQFGGEVQGGGIFAGLGFLAIIIFPILYALGGLIGGAIWGLIFNLVAKWTGGIEIELSNPK